MIIVTEYSSYEYQLKRLCNIFYPWEKHSLSPVAEGDNFLKITTSELEDIITVDLLLSKPSGSYSYSGSTRKSSTTLTHQLIIAYHIFKHLSAVTGINPPWGMLTGVRPVNMLGGFVEEGGFDYASKEMMENRLVHPEKYTLAKEIYHTQEKILSYNTDKSFSLYIGIPFCPSRCSYCSFVSHAIHRTGKLVAPYVKLLAEEIAQTGAVAKELGLSLLTVYIGGGTPTTLSPEELEIIMSAVRDNFDMTGCREYTVEAGRADTITLEKLQTIYSMGANRISINPQSFNPDVLKAVGRKHSPEDVVEKYHLARQVGFTNINMDVIAGLPMEDFQSFKNTIERISELSPENVTVHTLSLKRSSDMTEEEMAELTKQSQLVSQMVEFSSSYLRDNCYLPYYIYRQQSTLSNLENTGYCKSGYEGLYNVYMMEEIHTVLSCGAGAGSKIKPSKDVIKRVFNHKYPYEYIDRFEDILAKKQQIKAIYLG